jgi:restriction system protein
MGAVSHTPRGLAGHGGSPCASVGRMQPLMAKLQSDRYVRFYGPILDVLRDLGGSGTPKEVKRAVLDRVRLPDAELSRTFKSGQNAVENEIAWARNTLRELGLLDGSISGVWRLTEEGKNAHLTLEQARQLRIGALKDRLDRVRQSSGGANKDIVIEEDVESSEPGLSLLSVIQALPPAGFERLCQRLLREAGFSEVHVSGRSGDGGIDGDGILQVNELVSFRVLFQCKRYQGSVSPGTIRDFRGAMTGRTDKGIFLTTGSFTREAEREATREGAPPVELVDGERLVRLMERLGLGVKPRTVFDVDDRFFEEYR